MNRLIKNPGKVIAIFGLLIVLQACHPNGDGIPFADLDTVSTFYNSDDLSTAPASAAIVWDVANIKLDDGDDLIYTGEVDDDILNTTLDELVSLYGEANVVIISETATPVPAPGNASVTVVVPGVDPQPNVESVYAPSIILRKKVIGTIYPGYPWWGGGWWGGWYPGYYPGGCYYCGYPPTVSYQKFEVGSVILDMFDTRQLVGGEIPADYDPSWLAVMRGLISQDESFNAQRVTSSIRKAFSQSTYLN
ncbi:MAG: DUF4136 domain-containing protein [Bacteroidota bacterium]